MEKWIDIVTGLSILTGLIITLIVSVLDGKKEIDEKVSRLISKQVPKNMLVIKELENLKELVNADRVHIYEFHNGEYFANGRSALKMSCTFEVVRAGIPSVQLGYQKVPLTMIPVYINKLLREYYLNVSDLSEIEDIAPSTYQMVLGMGLTSFYDIVINNNNGYPVGILSIQYVKNPHGVTEPLDSQYVMGTKIYLEKIMNS